MLLLREYCMFRDVSPPPLLLFIQGSSNPSPKVLTTLPVLITKTQKRQKAKQKHLFSLQDFGGSTWDIHEHHLHSRKPTLSFDTYFQSRTTRNLPKFRHCTSPLEIARTSKFQYSNDPGHIHIFTHAHTYKHITYNTHTHTHIYKHIPTPTHTYTYTHIHIYTHTQDK